MAMTDLPERGTALRTATRRSSDVVARRVRRWAAGLGARGATRNARRAIDARHLEEQTADHLAHVVAPRDTPH